ncbi:hypothetical protein HKCCE3408_19310 [Rhodobacterales bacterium HKCCE3408]|nr:hypothetical protein [Rhodobacterales bacterium HKCCE3408]
MFAAGLAAASVASAQMADIDTDGDGLVTYEELLAVLPDMAEEDFAALDVDASGALDEAEISSGVDAGVLPAE